MKKLAWAAFASAGLTALTLGLAAPAVANVPPTATTLSAGGWYGVGNVALSPGGPPPVYPQEHGVVGRDDPHAPFGTSPKVPYDLLRD